MEKIIYALWKDDQVEASEFNQQLLQTTGPALCDKALSVRLNLQDEYVSGGTSPRAKSTEPQMDAIVQLWVDSANDALRAPIDDILTGACARFEAWLVSESTAIKNTQYPPQTGQRTEGFSQMVFLRRPDGMAWDEWRQHWHDTHTKVAIETQSNFEYQQNLVTRRLTETSGTYAAIVEECFPAAAFTNPLAYFDAPDDEPKMQINLKAMMDSVANFIDHTKMDCIPTSQYDLKSLF